jgi:hypothetical protein
VGATWGQVDLVAFDPVEFAEGGWYIQAHVLSVPSEAR